MTHRRIATAGVAVALSAALSVPATAHEPAGLRSSDNVRYITTVSFDQPYGQASRLATDMDFMTTTVQTRPGRGVGRGGPPHETERDFAFVGTYMNGMQVVDITEPTAPEVVAVYDCAVAQADVFVFERTDLGRTFVAYSSDTIASQTDFTSRCHRDNDVAEGEYGTFIIDVTDPYDPRSVSFIPFPRGTHQVTVHPDGRHVYSSPAALLTDRPGEFHVANIDDPWNPGEPVAVPLLTGLDAHDIVFDADGSRAYVAALTHTLVVDTTDPIAPTVIGRIVDPSIMIHHEAHPWTTVDATTGIEHTFLLIVDEFAGAAGNEVCPGGGVHVYDITGHLERAPVKLGAFFAPETGPVDGAGQGAGGTVRCTAHVMQIHPDQEIATIAWYALGTRILDLSGLVGLSAGISEEDGSRGVGIREVGYAHFDDGDVWATKTNRIAADGSFYVFAADTARMLDVFHVESGASTATPGGLWVSAGEAVPTTEDDRPVEGTLPLTCLVP
jgi:hypothetical protein